jgi:RNA polymerase sigma factor (sigma-70 family)
MTPERSRGCQPESTIGHSVECALTRPTGIPPQRDEGGSLMTADTIEMDRQFTADSDDRRPSGLVVKVSDAVRRNMAGDPTAFAELARCVTPWLLRICRGYRLSTATAEDVVQNTLLALIEHGEALRDPQCALSWLSVVARREALRAISAERRVTPVDDLDSLDRRLDVDDPQCIVERAVLRRMVQRNVARLPDRRRELLRLLFWVDDGGYAAIGDLLDMPIGSIGPTRRRALEQLRGLLDADVEWRRLQPA